MSQRAALSYLTQQRSGFYVPLQAGNLKQLSNLTDIPLLQLMDDFTIVDPSTNKTYQVRQTFCQSLAEHVCCAMACLAPHPIRLRMK